MGRGVEKNVALTSGCGQESREEKVRADSERKETGERRRARAIMEDILPPEEDAP